MSEQFLDMPYSELRTKAQGVVAEMRAMDAQIIHVRTESKTPRPTPFADCVAVIDGLMTERFKLKRFLERAITNAEDIAAGRADHIVDEINEYLKS